MLRCATDPSELANTDACSTRMATSITSPPPPTLATPVQGKPLCGRVHQPGHFSAHYHNSKERPHRRCVTIISRTRCGLVFFPVCICREVRVSEASTTQGAALLRKTAEAWQTYKSSNSRPEKVKTRYEPQAAAYRGSGLRVGRRQGVLWTWW